MKKKISMFTALLMALTLPFAARGDAGTRTETKDYYVGLDTQPTCSQTEIPEEYRHDTRFGGACFYLQGDEVEADFAIDDLSDLPIGAAYIFANSAGDPIGSLTPFCGSSTSEVPAGADRLIIYVAGPGAGPLFCLVGGDVGGPGTTGTITVTFTLGSQGEPETPIDEELDCQLEPVPGQVDSEGPSADAYADLAGITDGGQSVDLSVKVILDGVPEQRAIEVMQAAAGSYAPLGIDLTVSSIVTGTFTGVDAKKLIAQARRQEGGARPAGTDIVFVLTNRDITGAGTSAVAGLADCLGGIRYPERAFAIGEVFNGENSRFGPIPLNFYRNATANTVAHEIGHLMGGQHHLANCAEGINDDVEHSEATPCTLMFNAVDLLGSNFSTANGALVRGHAVRFATP